MEDISVEKAAYTRSTGKSRREAAKAAGKNLSMTQLAVAANKPVKVKCTSCKRTCDALIVPGGKHAVCTLCKAITRE